MTPALLALSVADTPEAWRSAGFTVDPDGRCHVGSVTIAVQPDPHGRGVTAWAFEDGGGGDDLDGLVTLIQDRATSGRPVEAPAHGNGTASIDHLVVTTPDFERTLATLADAGFELRRTRDGEAYGRAMRQAFFRMAEVVLEVVGPPEPSGDGPASFFGLAFTVEDLDATTTHLGEHLGTVKEAVQPGRRVATLRKTAGLTTAVAFMSPGRSL